MVKKRSSFAQHGPYLAIVAVVAVVAIVFLILNFAGISSTGEAVRFARTASTTTASECPECERNLVNAQSKLKECKNELSECKNVCYAGGVLLEGETKVVQAKADEKQEVILIYKDSLYSKFVVNGYTLKKLKDGESQEIPQLGVRITVLDSLYQSYAGGVHSATFCLTELKEYKINLLSCGVDIKAGDSFVLDVFDKGVINMKFLGTNYNLYPKARFQNLDNNDVWEYSLHEDNYDVTSVVLKTGSYSYRFESKVEDKFDVIHLVNPCNNIFYPEMFLTDGELDKKFNGFFVVGENAPAIDNLALTDIYSSMKYRGAPVEIVDATKLDKEITDVSAQNLIVVGNPCVNTVTAKLIGSGDCEDFNDKQYAPGQSEIRLITTSNNGYGSKMAMVVTGYSGVERRLAAKVIASRPNELSGSRVLIEGLDYQTAKLTVVK